MDAILLSIHPNDPLWIAIAFVFGLLVQADGIKLQLGELMPFIGFKMICQDRILKYLTVKVPKAVRHLEIS